MTTMAELIEQISDHFSESSNAFERYLSDHIDSIRGQHEPWANDCAAGHLHGEQPCAIYEVMVTNLLAWLYLRDQRDEVDRLDLPVPPDLMTDDERQEWADLRAHWAHFVNKVLKRQLNVQEGGA